MYLRVLGDIVASAYRVFCQEGCGEPVSVSANKLFSFTFSMVFVLRRVFVLTRLKEALSWLNGG